MTARKCERYERLILVRSCEYAPRRPARRRVPSHPARARGCARYIRWKRTEWGASPDTITTYEPILARLAVFYADLTIKDFEVPAGVDRLRECMDFHWGESAPATKQKTIAVWRDFFEWAIDNGLILSNPARKLRSPKLRDTYSGPFADGFVQVALQVTSHQEHLCDRLGVELISRYALRRAELEDFRFRDFDIMRRQLTLQGKGGKVRVIPIVDEPFWMQLTALEIDLGGQSIARDLFLLCPRRKMLTETRFYHYNSLKPRSVSRWWYDRLEEAGVVVQGDRTGHGMHRGRLPNTVATDILRRTGNIVAAKQLLGHSSTAITEKFYAGFDTDDLAAVLRTLRED